MSDPLETEIESSEERADYSGIRPIVGRSPVVALVARWAALQPEASKRPTDTHALAADVVTALTACAEWAPLESADAATGAQIDEWLEATYVLERLQWCIAHSVPYVVRPRAPQAL